LVARTGLNKKRVQGLKKTVNKHLLTDYKRMLILVPKVGYKISSAKDQIQHAHKRKIRAKRQVDMGNQEILNLDVSQLSPDEKVRHVKMINWFQTQLTVLRGRSYKTKTTITKAENTITKAKNEASGVLSEIANIEKQLEEVKNKIK